MVNLVLPNGWAYIDNGDDTFSLKPPKHEKPAVAMFENIPHLRIGQSMFAFLDWLSKRHPNGRYVAVADPFYISDVKLKELYAQWLASLENPT